MQAGGTAAIRAQRLSAAAGARLDGIDLSRPLSSDLKSAIFDAFLEHHVLVFPEQSLTREQQFAFAANFGDVEHHGAHRGENKRYAVAHVMSNLGSDGKPILRTSRAANYHWHTDKPYHRTPPMLTMLYAVEVPPAVAGRGGDTEFANTALAYEALPDATKRRIAGLRVAFSPAFETDRSCVVEHPLVCTHPDIRQKALYLGNHATHVVGMAESDSVALLGELLDHATQRRFVYAHRWRDGDLVMWDNRCLLHRLVIGDALQKYPRIMHRSVVRGTVPF
jgi:alpha-ketoglutarate-dependent taurine dioxygenase